MRSFTHVKITRTWVYTCLHCVHMILQTFALHTYVVLYTLALHTRNFTRTYIILILHTVKSYTLSISRKYIVFHIFPLHAHAIFHANR